MLYTDQNIAIDLHSYLHNMNKRAHVQTLLLYDRYQLKLTGEKMWCLTFLQKLKRKLLKHTIHSSSQLKWTIEAVKSQKHLFLFPQIMYSSLHAMTSLIK